MRFGRVPKREKAKILAAMESVKHKYAKEAVNQELEDEGRLVNAVVCAHRDTCEYSSEPFKNILQHARENLQAATLQTDRPIVVSLNTDTPYVTNDRSIYSAHS